eukprot:scaffold3932_cov156-Chaetoceros_neogracile.AAC.3
MKVDSSSSEMRLQMMMKMIIMSCTGDCWRSGSNTKGWGGELSEERGRQNLTRKMRKRKVGADHHGSSMEGYFIF